MSTRKITFEKACAMYLHRFTMDHVPAWAKQETPHGFYAPQYRSDREWYENTKFPGEPGWLGNRDECTSLNPTWPLGNWLKAPYRKGG